MEDYILPQTGACRPLMLGRMGSRPGARISDVEPSCLSEHASILRGFRVARKLFTHCSGPGNVKLLAYIQGRSAYITAIEISNWAKLAQGRLRQTIHLIRDPNVYVPCQWSILYIPLTNRTFQWPMESKDGTLLGLGRSI